MSIKKICYLLSQASINLVSIVLVIYLSVLGEHSTVVKVGVFYSFIAIFQSTMSFRMELAIYKEKNELESKKFITVALLNSVICYLILLSIFIVVWNVSDYKTTFSSLESISILSASLFASFNFVCRQLLLKQGEVNTLIKSNFLSLAIQIVGFLLVIQKDNNFIVSFSLVYAMSMSVVLFQHWHRNGVLINFNVKETKSIWMKNKNFFIYSTPGLFVNLLSQNILIIYLSGLEDQKTVATLIIAFRLLNLPLTLFSVPLSHLISTKVSEKFLNNESLYSFYKTNVFKLFLIAVGYNFFLWCIPESLYAQFGIEKGVLESLLLLLLPIGILRITISPLSNLINVMGKQKSAFYLQIINLFSILLVVQFGTQNVMSSISLYSISSAICQSVVFFYLIKVFRDYDKFLR